MRFGVPRHAIPEIWQAERFDKSSIPIIGSYWLKTAKEIGVGTGIGIAIGSAGPFISMLARPGARGYAIHETPCDYQADEGIDPDPDPDSDTDPDTDKGQVK